MVSSTSKRKNSGLKLCELDKYSTRITHEIKLWLRQLEEEEENRRRGRGRLVNAEFSHNEEREWPGTKKRREAEKGREREGNRTTSCGAREAMDTHASSGRRSKQ